MIRIMFLDYVIPNTLGKKLLISFRVEKGWSLNPLQFPPCFHICLTLMHTQEGVVEKFLKDIKYERFVCSSLFTYFQLRV